jgi:hypothetical protein
MPVIPELGRLRQENCELKVSLGYVLRHCLKKQTNTCLWLMPVILATQEGEIRRMVVRSQPCANSLGNPVLKIPNKKTGLVDRLKW